MFPAATGWGTGVVDGAGVGVGDGALTASHAAAAARTPIRMAIGKVFINS
jgi:hypothetical protein